jgi:tripartite-type tricarboxylate transporter receptor subunit TctC
MGKWFWIAAAMTAALATGGLARAQSFPTRPVHIFVPYAAGGGVDILARTLGDVVSRQWGQAVVVENRPGAGGVVASQALTQAAPDGYTLIVVASGHATNPFLYPKLSYDTFKDFTPISLLASSPNILLVKADSPFKTLGDVIAAAKAKPGSLEFANAGPGTSTHLAGELLKTLAKIDINSIPYKGGAPAITDLLGERITFMPINPVEVIAHIRAGRLRALAVASDKRLPLLPDVPTAAEAGLPGYEASVWWGLVAPAKTPQEIVRKLNGETNAALANPAIANKLAELGVVVTSGTPDQFTAFIKSQTELWSGVIKSAGIQPD